jgi:hypothetical protein
MMKQNKSYVLCTVQAVATWCSKRRAVGGFVLFTMCARSSCNYK